MNNQLSINLIKEVKLLFSFLFLSAIFCTTTFAQGNDDVQIRHYQKKLKLNSFIFKGDPFESNIYPIPLPDSIYDGGNISIKKMSILYGKYETQFNFSKGIYTSITYTPKNKKSRLLLLENLKNMQRYEEKAISNRKKAILLK